MDFISKKLSSKYSIIKAGNGAEAIEILNDQIVDLVISDIVMPKMDGLELCKTIKMQIDFSHIPVILLTAKTNIQSHISGLESGAEAYIDKPFSLEYLSAQIENILTNRAALMDLFVNTPFVKPKNIDSSTADEEFISNSIKLINENMGDEGFNIDGLAQMLNMSRSSLHRKIKGVIKLTPNEFIKLIRLKKAAELLLEKNYRINEICVLVAFNSSSYFTKSFQKQFGVLPKEYAKNPKQ